MIVLKNIMVNHYTKIGLGTVQFGMYYGISNSVGKTKSTEVSKLLDTAEKYGIDLLDTASAYGDAEKQIGENMPERFKIVSKFMPPEQGDSVNDLLEASLKQLKKETLYGYLAHRPLALIQNGKVWDQLHELKEKGVIQKIGFSLNSPDEAEMLLEAGFIPNLVQLPYNYFDRRFESLINSLKKNGCEIHARSVFLQGLFFMKPDDLSSYFIEVKKPLIELQKSVTNLTGSLLHFVLNHPLIDRVIIGVENNRQLVQNLESIKVARQLPNLGYQVSEHIVSPSNWPEKNDLYIRSK